jgi:hypothetical protein
MNTLKQKSNTNTLQHYNITNIKVTLKTLKNDEVKKGPVGIYFELS